MPQVTESTTRPRWPQVIQHLATILGWVRQHRGREFSVGLDDNGTWHAAAYPADQPSDESDGFDSGGDTPDEAIAGLAREMDEESVV